MSENDMPWPAADRTAPATGVDDPDFLEAHLVGTHPASFGAAPPTALPQRIRRVPALAGQSRTGPPHLSIEILRRVIDGLHRL
jgi:hypothetical protein